MDKDIVLGNLYDFNKSFVKKNGSLTEENIQKGIEKIKEYMLSSYKYFMLLNNERHDYTVFNLSPREEGITPAAVNQASKDVVDVMQNRGVIYSIDNNYSFKGIEIWVEIDGDMFAYYLFAYDEAVIEVER